MNKSDISAQFSNLRKYGAKVFNFQSHKKMLGHSKDWLDIVVIYRNRIYFLEIKTKSTKDKLSPGQIETRELLTEISSLTTFVTYREVNEENHTDIIYEILNY